MILNIQTAHTVIHAVCWLVQVMGASNKWET